MSRWAYELDPNEMNQEVLKEYTELETKIEQFLDGHPRKNMTEEDHEELSGMLRERVSIMNRLGKK